MASATANGSALDRTPPENYEMECSVLSCMLQDRNAAERVLELLTETDFYREAHQRIYRAIERLSERGVTPDLVTVVGELKAMNLYEAVGGFDTLHKLVQWEPALSNAEYYARKVEEPALLRRQIEASHSLASAAYADPEKNAHTLRATLDLLHDLRARWTGEAKEADRTFHDCLLDIIEQGEAREEKEEVKGIDTGFPRLDRMTKGLRAEKLWLIAARPSVGKTSLCLSMIQHIARKHPVVFFSMEQPKEEIAVQLLSMVSGISSDEIECAVWTDPIRRRLSEAYVKMKDWRLTVEPKSPITLSEISQTVRRAREEGACDVVFIDYAQQIDFSDSLREREGNVRISRGAKQMAKEHKIPVVLLAQLNRDIEKRAGAAKQGEKVDKYPMLSDLGESGSYERDADVILFPYRDLAEAEELPSDSEQQGLLFVRKNRRGRIGKVGTTFRLDRTFWSEYGGSGHGY